MLEKNRDKLYCSAMANEPTPEEYYRPVTQGYARIDNENARRIWFEETEPEEQPTHKRILLTKKAEEIARAFITACITDVRNNSSFAWQPGSRLPGWKNNRQPLADGSPDTYTL